MNSRRAFLGILTVVFAASAAMTIVWCASMAAMGEVQMPGGWALSMMWMRMPGQTWLGATSSFVAMWTVMMVAMMLPSLTPTLWRYREVAGGRLTALVGAGYFAVWALVGIIVFPLGVALAATLMREPALAHGVPMVVGAAVLTAGVLQQTGWKARHLTFCREASTRCLSWPVDRRTALRHGVRLGVHCSHSCAGLTIVLLAVGVMDLRVMALVMGAITAEHLAPATARVARAIGVIAVAGGVCLIVGDAAPRSRHREPELCVTAHLTAPHVRATDGQALCLTTGPRFSGARGTYRSSGGLTTGLAVLPAAD